MKKVLVPLAQGFEEIEAVSIIDVLRRAKIEVTTVHLTENPVRGAHNIGVTADKALNDIDPAEFAMVCLPGGLPGSVHLRDNDKLMTIIKKVHAQGGYAAAICAAPMALGKAGLLAGKKATCYPGVENEMTGAIYKKDPVVVDGRIVTGNGPANALRFALTLVELLTSQEVAEQLAQSMLTEVWRHD